jgi:phospholipid/cholesterol/gamma-HCH transport system substrate-binding protein
MSRNIVETVLGAVVLLVTVAFLGWAYARSDAGDPGGYTIIAQFDRADGLEVGSDVRISGIKVGQILSTSLNPQTFRAEVRFSVRDGIELPSDSSAAVVSASLLGGKYLAVTPGGDEKVLADGGTIQFTQSAVNIEDLIGKYIFGAGGQQGGGQGGAGAQPGAAGGAPGAGAGAGGGQGGTFPDLSR